MNGEEECEAEEGDDNQINKTNRNGWSNISRSEWPEIVCRETDSWGNSLRSERYIGAGDAGVLHDALGPQRAKCRRYFFLEGRQLWDHIRGYGILISRGHVNYLSCAIRIVSSITLIHGLTKECSGVSIDDNGSMSFEVVYCFSYSYWVIIEL